MKVREERILADRNLAKNGGQVDELLGACWKETLDAGTYDFGDRALNIPLTLESDNLGELAQLAQLAHGVVTAAI